jgi:hypothetical protein
VDGLAAGDSSFIASYAPHAGNAEEQATNVRHSINIKPAASSWRGGQAKLPMLMINAASLMLAKAESKMLNTLQRVRRARKQGLTLSNKARSTMPVAELVNNALDLQRRALSTADETADWQTIHTDCPPSAL